MSIQAVAWALEQDLPARPKLVLVSIANHADHRTGYCWLKAETIADEASCSPRAVFNFIGDLVRNGFIRKALRKGDDGKQRANDYWILFDRVPGSKWIGDRNTLAHEADDVTDDNAISGEPHAPGASGESGPEPASDPVDNARGAVGPHASACSRKDSDEPSKSNPEKKAGAHSFAAPPRSYHAPPIAPDIQGDLHPKASKPIFVRAGTRAWDAWVAYKLRTTGVHWSLTSKITIDGERRTGWHFPTLFPPGSETASESSEEENATGPPLKKPA